MIYDLYFYEAFAEEAPAIQAHLPAGIRAGYTHETIQASQQATPPAPILSIRTQSRIPDAWLPQLRAIQSRSTGYDHLLPYMSSPVILGALPKYCGQAVAEQALLLMLALLRKLPRQQAQLSTFNRDGLTGAECSGKTLLIAGVGDIGHRLAKLGGALGMRVLGCDPQERHPDIRYVPLEQGLSEAEIIACCMNLTEINKGIFNAQTLRAAPRGAIFINVARGECAPLPDLLALLSDGHLGGVGLDVFEDEPLLADALRHPEKGRDGPDLDTLRKMMQRNDVILTPHNAFNTTESVIRKSAFTAQQIEHFIKHGTFRWPLKGTQGTQGQT